jgi:hypothetical protein
MEELQHCFRTRLHVRSIIVYLDCRIFSQMPGNIINLFNLTFRTLQTFVSTSPFKDRSIRNATSSYTMQHHRLHSTSHKPLVRRRHTVFPYGAFDELEKSDNTGRGSAEQTSPVLVNASGHRLSLISDRITDEDRSAFSFNGLLQAQECDDNGDMTKSSHGSPVVANCDEYDEHTTFGQLLGTPDFSLYAGDDERTSSPGNEDRHASLTGEGVVGETAVSGNAISEDHVEC